MVKVHIQVVRFLNWFFDTLLAACGAAKVKHEAFIILKATFKSHDALWKNFGTGNETRPGTQWAWGPT